jgi:hypothetical protein
LGWKIRLTPCHEQLPKKRSKVRPSLPLRAFGAFAVQFLQFFAVKGGVRRRFYIFIPFD